MVGGRAHCRRFSKVPLGDDELEGMAETVQSGYQRWFFGLYLYGLWLLAGATTAHFMWQLRLSGTARSLWSSALYGRCLREPTEHESR